jgi:hypothetical protein
VLRITSSILLSIVSTFCLGNIDSTFIEVSDTQDIIIKNPNIINGLDTLLFTSTLLNLKEDPFIPSLYSVGSGLYKFPLKIDLDDYGWISKNIMLTYEHIKFKNDTVPRLITKYDHANNSAHWFTAQFDRMIGKSKLSTKLNRNSQLNLYPNTVGSIGKKINFLIGSEIPFKNKYILTLSYFRNQAFIQDNGGFNNADSILSSYKFNEIFLRSNLSSASSFIFSQRASVLQKIKIGPAIKIDLESNFEENKYSFSLLEEGINSNFFSNIFLDSTETFDSIGFRKIAIKPLVKLGNLKKKGVPFLIFGVNKEINDKNILNDSYAQGKLNFDIFKNSVSILGKYHFENVWKGNYNLESKTTLILKNNTGDTIKHMSKIDLNVNYKSELPSYLFINYFGNHFQWENNFEPMKNIKFCTKLNLKKLNSIISLEVQNISNYIYLNESSLPEQTKENITAGNLSLKKQLGIKNIKLYTGMGFQFSNSNLIRVPTFYTRNNLVYQLKLRKVPFNIGSTFSFFNQFIGLNYNPAIRHYYLGKQTVGGTPVVDFFIASRLGPADIYVKYENALYNLKKDLFLGENYPVTFSLLRFGLKWNLIN